jgi:hypothetical protein
MQDSVWGSRRRLTSGGEAVADRVKFKIRS